VREASAHLRGGERGGGGGRDSGGEQVAIKPTVEERAIKEQKGRERKQLTEQWIRSLAVNLRGKVVSRNSLKENKLEREGRTENLLLFILYYG